MGGVRDDEGSYRNLFELADRDDDEFDARDRNRDGALSGDAYAIDAAARALEESRAAEAEVLARGRTNRITLPEAGIAAPWEASSFMAPSTSASLKPSTRDAYDHPAIGKLIAGRYLIERLIGIGGMADVFEAHHAQLGRKVAVKVVSPCLDVRGDVALRLKREAAAAAALESDHVVEILDVGEDRVLGIYVVMELLRGDDLERMVKARGTLDAVTSCGIALQACLALERAHAAGIFHRDLKPSNFFLTEGDDGSLCVKLVDFGIAKVLRDANGASHGGITRTGTVVGTPQYMAPELARGDSVDQRADIYSLGAVLFECLTGRPPVEAKATYEETVFEVTSQPREPIGEIDSHVPRELAALVADMMTFDPDKRIAHASAVRRRIVALYPHLGTPLLSLSPFALASRASDATADSARPSAPRTRSSDAPASSDESDATTGGAARRLTRRIGRALRAPGVAPLAFLAFGALFIANVAVLVLNVRGTSHTGSFAAQPPPAVTSLDALLPAPPHAVVAPYVSREADAGALGDGKLRAR